MGRSSKSKNSRTPGDSSSSSSSSHRNKKKTLILSSQSKSNTNSMNFRRIRAVSFGRNYFYQRSTLPRPDHHDSAESEQHDGPNNAVNEEEGPWQQNQSQQQQQSQLLPIGAVCTAQSTVVLTAQGHLYQTGTLHGRVFQEWTRITPPLPLQCVQVSAGRHFVVARLEKGQAVVTWGAGHFGQLGVTEQRREYYNGGDDSGGGTITTTAMIHAPEPVIVQRLLPSVTGSPIRQVAAGDWHCLALTESGTVWCWGSNRSLQCGVKHANNGGHPAGSTVALPCPLTTLPEIVQIAAGRSHSVALAKMNPSHRNNTSTTTAATATASTSTGDPPQHQHQLYAWGSSQHGQCGTGITTRRGIPGLLPASIDALPAGLELIQIAAAGHHTLALSKAGRVFAWGDGREGQLGLSLAAGSNSTTPATTPHNIAQLQTSKPRLVADLDFVAVAAAQMQQQQQQESGLSTSSAAETLASIPKIVSVHAAASYSAALSSSGHVYCWGSNDVGQLGLTTPPPQQLPWCDGSMDLDNPLPNPDIPEDTVESVASTSRHVHARNFDSNHNVLLPMRVEKLDHMHVSLLALGPNHMWCFGEERPPDSHVVVGRTLHEVQEEQRVKRLESLASLSTKARSVRYSSGESTTAAESEESQATALVLKPESSIFENEMGAPAGVLNDGTLSPVPSLTGVAQATAPINTTNTSGSSGSTSEEESQMTSVVLDPSDSFLDPSANENDAAHDCNDDALVAKHSTAVASVSSQPNSTPMAAAATTTGGAITTATTATETATNTTRQKRTGILKRLSSKLLRRRSSRSTTSPTSGGMGHRADHTGGEGSESTAGITATTSSRRRGGLWGLQDVLAGHKRS